MVDERAVGCSVRSKKRDGSLTVRYNCTSVKGPARVN